jgi:exopolysaccharide production protein ExoQ
MNAPKALVWVAALLLAACLFSHTIALRLLLLALGIALTVTVLGRDRELQRLPSIWIPFALWAAWAALSLAWSVEPERSLKEWRNEVFYAGVVLWVCFVAAQAREATRIVLPVVSIAAFASCAVALHAASGGWESYQQGWHGGAGNHSSALLMLMPCVLVAGWHASRRGPRWWTMAMCAALAVLFLASAYATLSRTVWLGFALEFVLLGALLLPRARARLVGGVLTGAVVVAAGAALLSIQADRQLMGARKFDQDPRLALWSEVLSKAGERPLGGHGFGRGILRGTLQKELGSVDAQLWHPHNLFFDTLLQLGVPGLVILLLLLGAILREGWRLTHDADEAAVACGIALLTVVAGMVVRNTTDTLLVRQNALLFWGVTGMLLGLPLSRAGVAGRTPAPSDAAARAPRPG